MTISVPENLRSLLLAGPPSLPSTQPQCVWDLQWQVLECECLGPAADLSGAMVSAIERLASDGWEAEATSEYGFVFIRKGANRRLLMLTPRDPYSTALQSFSPFRS